uniref:Uncharacterized protein n=1 Tax=Musa acuminata TaxID=4641 RepID=Q1EPJ7_MUSAC|nr:hypothetical protein MA4_25J11.36 [Musa acuminata]
MTYPVGHCAKPHHIRAMDLLKAQRAVVCLSQWKILAPTTATEQKESPSELMVCGLGLEMVRSAPPMVDEDHQTWRRPYEGEGIVSMSKQSLTKGARNGLGPLSLRQSPARFIIT